MEDYFFCFQMLIFRFLFLSNSSRTQCPSATISGVLCVLGCFLAYSCQLETAWLLPFNLSRTATYEQTWQSCIYVCAQALIKGHNVCHNDLSNHKNVHVHSYTCRQTRLLPYHTVTARIIAHLIRHYNGEDKLWSLAVLLAAHQLHHSKGMQEVAGLKGQSGTDVSDSLAEVTVTFKTAPLLLDC